MIDRYEDVIVRICLGLVAALFGVCVVGLVVVVVVGLVALGWWMLLIPPVMVLLGAIGYVVGGVAERWP